MTFRHYNDPLYKQWRKNIYKRDKFTCQWPNCNCKKKLNAHHIKTWANYPHLRFDSNNGITLCKQHHDMIKGLEEIYESVFYQIVLKNKTNDQSS